MEEGAILVRVFSYQHLFKTVFQGICLKGPLKKNSQGISKEKSIVKVIDQHFVKIKVLAK